MHYLVTVKNNKEEYKVLKVDIDLKDGTTFNFQGEKAENAKKVHYDECGGLIYFGDIVIIPKDNLSSYYCREEEETES